MRENQPFSTKEYYYYKIKDDKLDALSKASTVFFHLEKNEANFVQSKAKIEEAITLAREKLATSKSASDHYDLAFLLRRYASILIRDVKNEDHINKAKFMLDAAYDIHASESDKTLIIYIEEARILHQLRKVAYDLRDGYLLGSVSRALIRLIRSVYFPEAMAMIYLADSYESLFHIHFAKRELSKVIELLSLNSYRTHTLHRHRAKLCLARIILEGDSIDNKLEYLITKVENNFWESFDHNKNNFSLSFKNKAISKRQAGDALLDDLVFLFAIRCQKSLLSADKGERPMEYVLRQAKNSFHDKYPFLLLDEGSDLSEDLENSILKNEFLVIKKSQNRFYIYCKSQSEEMIKSLEISQYTDVSTLMNYRFDNSIYYAGSFSPVYKILYPYAQESGMEMPKLQEDRSYRYLKSLLQKKVNVIKNTQKLPLDYSYFPEPEPISLKISEDQFPQLFQDYKVEETVSGSRGRDALFSTSSQSAHNQEEDEISSDSVLGY